MNERDPYFDLPEVSNSDLSWLEKLTMPMQRMIDCETAYRFGTLIDAMITEAFKINYFQFTCAGIQYTRQEFELAEEMKKSFYRDPLCRKLAENAEFQKVSRKEKFSIVWDGLEIFMNVRCKWDLYAKPKLNMTGDIKSTTATTQKQFIAACNYFSYFRQRAWYMDIEDVNFDVLIGISKVNKEVFKVPIVRGEEFYCQGKAEYSALAFQYWSLFHNLQIAA